MTSAEKMKTANIVIGVAIAAMAIIALCDRLLPRAKEPMTAAARTANLIKFRQEAHKSEENEKTELQYVASRVWSEEIEAIGPKTLDRATNQAKALGLSITAFRPQRTVEDGKLTRVPFYVTMSGTYPKIAQFIRAMENPSGKVMVTSVQLNATDGVSDVVTATIGLLTLKDGTVVKKIDNKTTGTGAPRA